MNTLDQFDIRGRSALVTFTLPDPEDAGHVLLLRLHNMVMDRLEIVASDAGTNGGFLASLSTVTLIDARRRGVAGS